MAADPVLRLAHPADAPAIGELVARRLAEETDGRTLNPERRAP
jgi:hypothetical protein